MDKLVRVLLQTRLDTDNHALGGLTNKLNEYAKQTEEYRIAVNITTTRIAHIQRLLKGI